MVATDREESVLGDVHLRGGRRPCRRPTRGSLVVGTDPEKSSPRDFRNVGTTFVSATDQGADVGGRRPTWLGLGTPKRGASPWGSWEERPVASAAEPLGQQFRRA